MKFVSQTRKNICSSAAEKHHRFMLGLATLIFCAAVDNVGAIPTNPDPCHSAVCTPWSSVPIGLLNPATDQHQHRNTQNLFAVNAEYKTYAAWDNNQYRYDSVNDRTLTKALDGRDYGHGFMQRPAEYRFDASVPVWAQGLIFGKVEPLWENLVNEDGTNTNGAQTRTRIDLAVLNAMAGGDLLIEFKPQYQVGAAGSLVPKDFPEDSDIPDDGGNGPVLPGGAPQGGRSGVLAFWNPSIRVLTFNSGINWYQDVADDGKNFDPAFRPNQFDFVTTALHEWGHVLGLDHPENAVAGTTMFPQQGRRGFAPNGIMRGLDMGTIDGAKNLYTIAIPEPGTLALLSCGLLVALVTTARRRCRDRASISKLR